MANRMLKSAWRSNCVVETNSLHSLCAVTDVERCISACSSPKKSVGSLEAVVSCTEVVDVERLVASLDWDSR